LGAREVGGHIDVAGPLVVLLVSAARYVLPPLLVLVGVVGVGWERDLLVNAGVGPCSAWGDGIDHLRSRWSRYRLVGL
jgi:hypothetical protein